MKPKLYSYLAFVLFAAIFIVACKKGDTGPAGPAGPAGAAGTAGAPGPKGDSATANVIYSAWLDVPFQILTDDTTHPGTIDTLGWEAVISAPKLTNTILSQGTVKVYFNYNTAAAPDIIELPFTDPFSYGLNITTEFVQGQIFLFSLLGDPSTQTTTGGKIRQFRYVLIPGTVPASVNVKDYNSVKNYFKMPN
jgi:hypothetical protein